MNGVIKLSIYHHVAINFMIKSGTEADWDRYWKEGRKYCVTAFMMLKGTKIWRKNTNKTY